MAGPRFRLLALALLVAACAPPGQPDAPGEPVPPPAPRSLVRFEHVRGVGSYLDATLVGQRGRFRFYFPASPDCAAVVHEGGEARYLLDGPFGVVRGAGEERCEPVGVADLAPWRDLQPQRRSRFLVPREQAEYRTLADGPEEVLVRGRFPLAIELRWPEPMDTVAVLPASAACRELAAAHEATLEYRATGPDVLLLEGDAGLCPITGLALPLEID